MALGRISGPLLKSNLLRNGVDLAFETNLLYLDVTNRRVGINTSTPSDDLQVSGTTRTTNLNASGSATIGGLTFASNSITSSSNTINLTTTGANPVVYQGTLQVGNLQLTGSTISTIGYSQNINLTTTGTGATTVNGNLTVNGNFNTTGNLTVQGTLTVTGNIQIGDQTTDTVSITAGITSNVLPNVTNTYNLGSSSLQWANIYANSLTLGTFTANNLSTANFTFSGNSITNTASNQDILITTTGAAGVNIGNFRISGNTIQNTVANAISNFQQQTSTSTFNATITAGTTFTFSGSVSGTTLTVNSVPGGTIAVGQVLSGGSLPTGTFIVANIAGSGNGSQWQINNYLTQANTTITVLPTVLNVTGTPTGTIYKGMVLTGAGVTSGTVITALLTGTGGAGSYYITPSQALAISTSITGSVSGYVNIGGTNGVVIPSGTTLQRPSIPTQGMIRFNSDPSSLAVEIYNGSAWTSVAGVQSGITVSQASDISVQWALTLG